MNTEPLPANTRSKTRLERLRARRDPDGIDPLFKTAGWLDGAKSLYGGAKSMFGGAKKLAPAAAEMAPAMKEMAPAMKEMAPAAKGIIGEGVAAARTFKPPQGVWQRAKALGGAGINQVAPLTSSYVGYQAAGEAAGGPQQQPTNKWQALFPTNNLPARLAGAAAGYGVGHPQIRNQMLNGKYSPILKPVARATEGMIGGWGAGMGADVVTDRYRGGVPSDVNYSQVGSRLGLAAGALDPLSKLLPAGIRKPVTNAIDAVGEGAHGFGMGSMAANPMMMTDNVMDVASAIRGKGEYAGVPFLKRLTGNTPRTVATRVGQVGAAGLGGLAINDKYQELKKDPEGFGNALGDKLISSPTVSKVWSGITKPFRQQVAQEGVADFVNYASKSLGLPEQVTKQIQGNMALSSGLNNVATMLEKGDQANAVRLYEQLKPAITPEMAEKYQFRWNDENTGQQRIDPKRFAVAVKAMAADTQQQNFKAITDIGMNEVMKKAGPLEPFLRKLTTGGASALPEAVGEFAQKNPELTQKTVAEIMKKAGPTLYSGGIDAIANPILSLFSPDAANSMSTGQKTMMLGGILAMFTGILSGGGGMGLGSGIGVSGLLMLIPMLWPMIQKMFSGNAAAAPAA